MTRSSSLALPFLLCLALPAAAQTPSRIAVITDPMPSAEGAPVTITALVSARDGVPAGTVTFRDGATVLGTATLVPSGDPVTTGSLHSCAITGAGGVMCWGWNSAGQLGDGTLGSRLTPVAVQGLPARVVHLAAGTSHTCALTEGGGVWCWGDNAFGQLGDGTNNSSAAPVQAAGLASGVTNLTAGGQHSCAVTSAGAALCWGRNNTAQLGDATTDNRNAPTAVDGLGSGVSAISAGTNHSCALLSDNTARCWGGNIYGQLGDGSVTQRNSPVVSAAAVGALSGITAGGLHTCVTNGVGSIYCFGRGQMGQIGNGGTTTQVVTPQLASQTFRYVALGLGTNHSCGVHVQGAVRCWGWNEDGQIGIGTSGVGTDQLTPALTTPRLSAWAIDGGSNHSCAVERDGSVMCWGAGGLGQLGDGTATQRTSPTPVAGGTFALPMADAVARIVVSDLPPGRRALTATFEGSAEHDPSTSRVRRHLVQ